MLLSQDLSLGTTAVTHPEASDGTRTIGETILAPTGVVYTRLVSAVTLVYSGDYSVFHTGSTRQRQNVFNRYKVGCT